MPNSPGRSFSDRRKSPSITVSGTYNTNSQGGKDSSIIKSSRPGSPGFPIAGPISNPASSPVSGQQSAEFVVKDNTIVNNSTLRSGLPGSTKREPSTSYLASQRQPNDEQLNEPTGPLDLTVRAGARFELCFGIAAFCVFLSLWIYLMTVGCFNQKEIIFYFKVLPMIGALSGLFIAIYSCFERTTTPRKGLSGCILVLIIVVVASFNLVGAYLTVSCPCRCKGNPIADPGSDLTIMILEICGSICLLSILLVIFLTK